MFDLAAFVHDAPASLAPAPSSLEGSVVPDAERGVDEPVAAGKEPIAVGGVAASFGKIVDYEPPGDRPIRPDREEDGVPTLRLALV